MKTRMFIPFAAALVIALTGCGAQAASQQPSPAKDADPAPVSASAEPTPSQDQAKPQEPSEPLPDVSGKLPYIAMPAELIDETWLGPADEVADAVESTGLLAGSVPHRWRARNGTGDLVFSAYVRDGEVLKVVKENLGKDYWKQPGSAVTRDFPDLGGEGEQVADSASPRVPDPEDYDDAEDYANAAAGAFGSWDAAHDHWLEEMQ